MAAQEAYTERLLELENVVGVGTGLRVKAGKITNQVCVQVLVQRKLPIRQLNPKSIVPGDLSADGGDVPTDVLEVGLPEAQQDTGRYRPVPGGCSIGPEARNSAGTLGGFACDNTDDTIVLLTNNHVISNLDTQPALRRVVQAGRLDGGVLPGDVIGSLKRDVRVNTVANVTGAPPPPLSVVDAAIATVDLDRTDQIRQLNVPAIYEIQAPALNMNVQKRGRTTRLTTNGRITTINVTQTLTYRNRTRLGRIQNSFIITTNGNLFSDSGDSGSLILNQARGPVRRRFCPEAELRAHSQSRRNNIKLQLATLHHLHWRNSSQIENRRVTRTRRGRHADGRHPSGTFHRDCFGQHRDFRVSPWSEPNDVSCDGFLNGLRQWVVGPL
jgi:hypothetical protein